MIEVADLGESAKGRHGILIDYQTPEKFEKLDIRADRKTIDKVIEHLTQHKVKMAESSKIRRRSLF